MDELNPEQPPQESLIPEAVGGTCQFDHVFREELREIARRRRMVFPSQDDAAARLEPSGVTSDPDVRRGLVGLALSGGGIRSATFNLGVLQALAGSGILKHVDYLSTVSGGGYIGSCLGSVFASAAARSRPSTPGPDPDDDTRVAPEGPEPKRARRQSPQEAAFPFLYRPGQLETPALRHLRNHSNYLAPGGALDLIQLPALLLRGIVINLSVILPWIILSAFIAAAIEGPLIANADSVLDFYIATPLALGLVAGAAILSLLAIGHTAAQRSLYRRIWTGILLFPVLLFAVESLAGLTYLYGEYVLRGEVDIRAHIRALGGALAALLPVVLAGKAAERVSGIGGQIAIGLLGLLGPAALILIHVHVVQTLITTSNAIFDPGAGTGSLIQFWLSPVPAFLAMSGISLWLWNTAFFDANGTSMLSLYRDRLTKAYLFGRCFHADRESPGGVRVTGTHRLSELSSLGPYHILNSTMNLQGSQDLDLRGRNARNFVFSKLFSGSELTGYMATDELEKLDPNLDLGTAMAISAAAASPNMGMTTIPPLVLLMTLLNVRLGYWMANPLAWGQLPAPRRERARRWRPGAIYLAKEMLASMFGGPNHRLEFVNLTDGGHLENTGIYELLRRECRLIIACDAEADPNHEFPSLARLIRFASIDRGIQISIDLTDLARDKDGLSLKSWALGRITYSDERIGYLLYIKSSLMGDESEAIRTFKRRNPAFPHQTTGDQFFDEAQFESYRALGYEVASGLVEYMKPHGDRVSTCGELYRWAEELEAPLRPRGNLAEELNDLQGALNDLETRFEDPSVYEYARQIYPELDLEVPDGSAPVNYYKIFWLCIHQLNFMANVFVRLQLDKKHQREHHFNRGWMNLFRRWARSGFFIDAWTVAIGDYSEGFERFCRDILRIDRVLELGEAEVAPVSPAAFRAMESTLPNDLQMMLTDYNRTANRSEAHRTEIRVAWVSARARARGAAHALASRFPVGFAIVEAGIVQYYAVSERYRGMYYLYELFAALKPEIHGVNLTRVDRSHRVAARHFFERLGIEVFERSGETFRGG